MPLTQARLKELLHYCPQTGVFTWRVTRRRVRQGERAGTLQGSGYFWIRIDRQGHQSHRLAFLYMLGEWPPDQVDHINGVRTDNRFANLRPATNQQNCRNRCLRSDCTSGATGVYRRKDGGKWAAQIGLNGRNKKLGSFDTFEEAAEARRKAETEHFGEFRHQSSE